LAIGLDTVLQAEEFPASVTNLDTSLTDMKRDDFTHFFLLYNFNKKQSSKLNELQ